MTQTQTRMPTPIVAALIALIAGLILTGLNAVGAWVAADFGVQTAYWWTAAFAGFTYATVGVWRRWDTGRTVSVVVGLVCIFAGLSLPVLLQGLALLVAGVGIMLIVLVIAPQSSRDWFAG